MANETRRRDRSGAYLVLTLLALVVAIYLILQILGLLFKLLLLAAVVLIAVWAFRTWRQS